MIDRLDDIFSHEIHKKAFAKNPETIFNLPYLNKVLMNIVIQQDTNVIKNTLKYQGMNAD